MHRTCGTCQDCQSQILKTFCNYNFLFGYNLFYFYKWCLFGQKITVSDAERTI